MIEIILNQLSKAKKHGDGFMACCPAHDDKTPSLSLMELPDGRILMKCFAGCDVNSILNALGLSVTDLFPKNGLGYYKSFKTLEREIQSRKAEPLQHEKTILALADSDRKAGKRLSPKDLEREKQAYLRLRKSQQVSQ